MPWRPQYHDGWLRFATRLVPVAMVVIALNFTWNRSEKSECIGIDFVQFRRTGLAVQQGRSPSVYSSEFRANILDVVWKEAQKDPNSKYYRAVQFRHERSWETYSSPFLYAVFGLPAGANNENGSWRSDAQDAGTALAEESLANVAIQYEQELRVFQGMCLFATIVGVISIGVVLRISTVAVLVLAVVLVWFSPLRIDLTVVNVNQIQLAMVGILITMAAGKRGVPSFGCETLVGTLGSQDRLRPFLLLSGSRCQRRSTLRCFIVGCWLGLCVAFKPSLVWCGVMLGIFLFLQTRDRSSGRISASHTFDLLTSVAGGLAGATVAVGFSSIWYPVTAWFDWVNAVLSMPDTIITTSQGNFSPLYYAQYTLGVPRWLLAPIAPGLTTACAAILGRSLVAATDQGASRNPNRGSVVPWIIAGLQVFLLTSHLVWYHYFALSLPAVLLVISRAIRSASIADRVVLLMVAGWCLILLGIDPVDRILHSPPEEHMLRCLVANFLLLIATVMPERQQLD